jgi:hypothetical protein
VIICCLPSAFFAATSRAADKGNDRAVTEVWFEDAEVTVIIEAFGPRKKLPSGEPHDMVLREDGIVESGAAQVIGVRTVVFAAF